MAKVTVKTEVVETKTYTLELTEHEARSLYLILGQVGGVGPIRDSVSDIYDALPSSFFDRNCFAKFVECKRVLELVDGADF